MKSRGYFSDEIERLKKQNANFATFSTQMQVDILDVLLDIRDLLANDKL
jgi:hypothetical protein